MSVNEKMTAVAEGIRGLTGLSQKLGLDAMKDCLDSANGQSAAQADLIGQIKTALEGKAGGGSNVTISIRNGVLFIK